MSPLAKVFVVVNLILSVAFFGSSATLFATRTNWREEALRFRKQADEELKRVDKLYLAQGTRLQELAKSFEKLNVNYNAVSSDKNKLETQLTESKGELGRAQNRIETEVKEKTQLTSLRQDLEKKNTELARLLEGARKESEEAKSQKELATNEYTRIRLDLDKANDEHSKNLIAFNDLTEKASTMELQLQALAKSGIDIDFSGVPPPIDAVVQAVKTEDKLVVLSVGRDQKVQEGFEFTVYRGDRFIGKVKVIKVYQELAGARVLYTASENEAIQVGDKAATQL